MLANEMKSEEHVQFIFCPHCRTQTRSMPIKHKSGPTGIEVLALGLFAFLFSNRTRTGFLCEHCETVFDVSDPSITRGKFSGILLLLFIVLATAVAVTFVVFLEE